MMEQDWSSLTAMAIRQFQNELPFVLYAKPGQDSVKAMLQHDAVLHTTTDFDEPGFVFVSFDSEDRFLIPQHKSDILTCKIPQTILSAETVRPVENPDAKTNFETLVSKGIAAIQAGEFGKVVLSRTEAVSISNFDFLEAFKQLLAMYPTAFRYCWFHPETGLWMGATPERLLKIDNNCFETVALAGTQPFTDSENVTWGEKEKEEQQFVTDFIAEGLRSSVSGIELSEPFTARAGNLLHIKTEISGKLNSDSGLKSVLDILHPTPAVCGYPKEEARKFILENEGYDREFYSGFLGEVNFGENKKTDLFVNLRSMKINGNTAHLYIGCGITRDSNPEKEYVETVNKSLTMKKVLCNWIS